MWDRLIDLWCRTVGHNWIRTDPHRDACVRCHLHRRHSHVLSPDRKSNRTEIP